MPNDGGHLLLPQKEADEIRQNDPTAAKYIRQILGSEETSNVFVCEKTARKLNGKNLLKLKSASKRLKKFAPKAPTNRHKNWLKRRIYSVKFDQLTRLIC